VANVNGIAVCAIFKDEAPFLLEWIAYHKAVGVTHFVLYENGSSDEGPALIRSSRFAADVTLIDWPDAPGQLSAYRDFIVNHARRFAWVAFIDIDEFLHPLAANSLPAILRQPVYGAFAGLQLNWLAFGPSGHQRRPDGLAIENYTLRVPYDAPINRHIKSLLRCDALFDVLETPHVLLTQRPQCNARGELAGLDPLSPAPCHEVLVVNHYYTRSRQDWEIKLQRGRGDTRDRSLWPARRVFEEIAAQATVPDLRIARFGPAVRALLQGVG
jgi:hypothetical protein